ncbi:phosphatidylinositol glycan, class W [Sporothrix schenckii 1099-18]|uniref:GPI-anchored wall transfer protein n=1 Tax=Sporothrix schenckii 1099-18 TaxID=1397361 RepID=A0A0F2LVP8_SPOSC|nr:phosphatidylinositol glycan, class W [Sporothrix schenckii 1099-18]KJR81542.1 phosphatidylinositol glycan, class W [Sporothrix schenckii 1099-18]
MADSALSSGATAAAAAAANNYKQLKEDFVSNLSGGSANEVILVTAVAPVAVLAWSVLQRRQSFFRPYSPLAFVVDFFLNTGAILLAITLYSSQPLLLNGLLIAQTLFVLALPRGRPRRVAKKPPKAAAGSKTSKPSKAASAGGPGPVVLPKKAFLTTYRGAMMTVTCLAILAVDFRIFPRRFAKVETWGTSLMDMGVGSFVFSAGVVAARSVLKEQQEQTAGPSLARRLLTSLRHSVPLLALGIVRLLSVKGLDYAEHTSEYGVHWNFFFTLGLLPPFVAVAQAALQLIPSSAVLSLLLAGAYQVALETTDLKAYVLTAPRVDLISKNREGLASFIGYLAIFLAGQDTGTYLLPPSRPATPQNTSGGALARVRQTLSANRLAVWSVGWWVLYQLSINRAPYGLGLTESRRMANLPYVLWVLSFNVQQLTMFYLVDKFVFGGDSQEGDTDDNGKQDAAIAHDEATSVVLRAFNRNGLPIFLLANLLTGLVNMTVPTLDVGQAMSMGILVAYAGVVTAVAVALEVYNITIKL